MTLPSRANGVHPGRHDAERLEENFADRHAPFAPHEASVASDRCYFCHDAPCVTACPTSIDIPLFIRQIATGMPEAAAKTIFDQNILGGICARVCPTEELCEEACVREVAEGKPVNIGRLQRYATDTLMARNAHPYSRPEPTGKIVAVIGAGPAGLACAHRLAMHGHEVVIFEAKSKGGGLNEFGIAAYKTTDDFAQRELSWLLGIGGIDIRYNQPLGGSVTLDSLRADYDGVFIGLGLSGVNALRLEGEDKEHVEDAVGFIEDLRQSDDLGSLPIGRRVVVIGGGMTAMDAAVQSKLLGAEEVTIVYRRGQDQMSASDHEQDLAQQKGVNLIHNAMPVAIGGGDSVTDVTFAFTEIKDGRVVKLEETFTLAADQLFKAIGQTLSEGDTDLALENGKIAINENGRTSTPGIWAGGDCANRGEDLTVTAVAQGRDAAMDIHETLMGAR